MSAQDKPLDQYQQFMKIHAAALFRSARTGVFSLREGQQTLEQLCEKLDLASQPTKLVLDALVASIIEQYQEDYALSRAAHLLANMTTSCDATNRQRSSSAS